MAQGDTPAITLFAGGIHGYGYAVNPGADVYHWAFNMDCRNGRADLVAGPTIAGATSFGVRPPAVLDWEDSAGVPLLIIPYGVANSSKVSEYQDGVATLADDGGVNTPWLGAAIYRHDGSDQDAEMAFFCDGTSNTAIRSRTKAGAYDSTGHDAKADDLIVIGGDLWRVVDTYKLEKLTLDTDPTIEANWSGVRTPVGTASNVINEVLDLGGSPLCLTKQGAFKYNPAPTVARFENQTPFVAPHPDNGKGGFADGRGRIYYPTHTGRIIVLSFGSQSQQGPLRFHEINRDTPLGRLQTMTADEEFVYAAVDPGFVKTNQLGLIFKIDDGGVFSTKTTEVTDGKGTTSADVSALANNGVDFIYIGADEPFWGVFFEMHTVSALTGTPGWTAQYSTGSGWTAFTDQDSTLGLHESGAIVFEPNADVYASGLWNTQTVDSQADKYWIRLSPLGVTLTNAKIAAAYVIPYRPSYDPTNFPEIGAALAGALPKVLVGQWRGESIVWHDWLTFSVAAEKIVGMAVSRTRAPPSVGEQTLYCIGAASIHAIPIGPDALPARAAWPATNGIVHAIGFSGHNLGLPVNVKSVQKLVIHGEYLQSDDNLEAAYRWDNDDRWYTSDQHAEFPVVLENLEGRGRELHVAVQVSDATIDAHAPFITHAIIPEGAWTDHGPLHENLGSDFMAPQAI